MNVLLILAGAFLLVSVILSFPKTFSAFILSLIATMLFFRYASKEVSYVSLFITIMLFLKLIGNAIIPIIMAIIVTILFHPIVDFLKERYRIPRGITATLIVLLLLALFVSVFSFLVVKVLEQFQTVVSNLNNIYNYIPEDIKRRIEENIRSLDIESLLPVLDVARTTFSLSFNIIIGIFLSIYFLSDAPNVISTISRIYDLRKYRHVYRTFSKYLRAQIFIASIVGLMVFILSSLFGIRFSAIIGFLAGLFNLIPNVGFLLTVISSVVIILVSSQEILVDLGKLAIVFAIDQILETVLLTPRIMGSTFRIEPTFIILALVIGGSLLGVVGFVIAIPTMVILRNILFQKEALKLNHEDNSKEL